MMKTKEKSRRCDCYILVYEIRTVKTAMYTIIP
jgi:hypothetical protein